MKPNIILINCDDLGYGDLGCYGSTCNDTPALDRLASQGVRFTQFVMASSICTPSRAAMLTGCYPHRISMNRVLFPADQEGLHPGETTIASMLKGAGYTTALVGKWHLGDQPEFLPARFGFDRYFGLPYSNDMGRQVGDPVDKAPLPLVSDESIVETQPDQALLTRRYVAEAVDFMRASTERKEPFFLYLAHMYVHLPLYVPEAELAASRNGRYGAAVACIDQAWNALDRELDRLGISDNTIVLFTSDNGSRARGEGGSNGPFRGTKFSTWEGGFRLPLIARYPGTFPAGAECNRLLASVDLLPTIAAWVGRGEFATRGPIDGEDHSTIFTQPTTADGRELFAYFSSGNLAALRTGKWKRHYTRWDSWDKPVEAVDELYDLENDPGESRNLFAEQPEVVACIDRDAVRFREQLGDAIHGVVGTEVRPCGHCENPRPLALPGEHPAVVAEYDLKDRG